MEFTAGLALARHDAYSFTRRDEFVCYDGYQRVPADTRRNIKYKQNKTAKKKQYKKNTKLEIKT